MGNQICKNEEINKNKIYFFKNLYLNEKKGKKLKVKLSISIKEIADSEERICNITTCDTDENNYQIIGSTEKKSKDKSNNITFNEYFTLEYYFEKKQKLLIKIIKGITEEIYITLGNIMGSKDQKFIRKLSDDSILEISGEEIGNNNLNILFDISISGDFTGMGIAYLIKYLGTESNPENNPIYRSEINDNLSNFNFFIPNIPSIIISPNNKYNDNLISIEIHDCFHSKKLGEYIDTIVNFLKKEINITLPTGNALIKLKEEKEYSFIDYLKGGIEINLSIGIDFSLSNKPPNEPNSLHYIGNDNLNYYEMIIKYCGDIISNYNNNQLFTIFGFGGKLPGENNVNQCFALNGNQNKPEIYSINNVLSTYRNILPVIQFCNNNLFSPIIKEVIKRINEKIKEVNYHFYNILMILTNGDINDINDTIDNIVQASFLPISIIIIGIGNNDFGNLDFLFSDDDLIDSNNRKCDRNILQFFHFNKLMDKGKFLASEILKDIPIQILEYFQHKNIPP